MLVPILFLHLVASPAAVPALPPGKGKAIVARACKNCHALKVVTSKRATKEQWSAVVDQMVSRGADLSDDEIDTVVNYLAKNFGPHAKPAAPAANNFLAQQDLESVNVNQASATELSAVLGISAQQSGEIVSYREAHGKFKNWRGVARVPGVHASEIKINKDRLRF